MRAFIAVDLDAPLRKALDRVQQQVRSIAPKLRYVAPDAMHLTIKFLGEIDPRRVSEIATVLDVVAAESAPFEFAVRDLGVFADRGNCIRVLWVGIDDTEGSLAALQQRVEQQLESIGFPPEGRPFAPHLTLARAHRPMPIPQLTSHLERAGSANVGTQGVDSIVLYESDLTRDGPIYTALSRHDLRGIPL